MTNKSKIDDYLLSQEVIKPIYVTRRKRPRIKRIFRYKVINIRRDE